MKRKVILNLLIVIGVILVFVSVLLALHEMSTMSVIGGADWPTFQYVFCSRNGGLYSNLAWLGVLTLITALIVNVLHKKRN